MSSKARSKRRGGKKKCARRPAAKVLRRGRTGGKPREKSKGKSMREAAAFVAAHLAGLGFDPVLTGRACAAFYGGASIKSRDIEFVIKDYSVSEVSAAMSKIGYNLSDDRTFSCRGCDYNAVLSPGPLAVGDDVVGEVARVKVQGKSLKLLTPTDCVRHRLATYYRWGDEQALAEAVKVAARHKISLDLVRRWSGWEWASDRFGDFMRALGEREAT